MHEQQNLAPAMFRSGGIVNHGEGSYEASYVVTCAGEYQLVVGLAGDPAKSVFRGECAPGPVSPGHCEVQHAATEIAAGQAGQLRFWTADRCDGWSISCAACIHGPV